MRHSGGDGVIVLVCGGRDYTDRLHVYRVLNALNPTRVVNGGHWNGADRFCTDWAKSRRVPYREYKANWRQHGKAAGPIRNQYMLDQSTPDLVVAFHGGRGTADMVKRVVARGYERSPSKDSSELIWRRRNGDSGR